MEGQPWTERTLDGWHRALRRPLWPLSHLARIACALRFAFHPEIEPRHIFFEQRLSYDAYMCNRSNGKRGVNMMRWMGIYGRFSLWMQWDVTSGLTTNSVLAHY